MGFLARALAAPAKVYLQVADEIASEREKNLRLRLDDPRGWASLGGRESHSGKTVTLDSALQLSTVFGCVKLSAQACSSLPIHVYEKRPGNDRVRVDDDPIAEIIGESPNQDQTALEFWEEMVAGLMLGGNSMAERVYSGKRLFALQPLPSCVPHREADGTLVYKFSDRGGTETLPRDKVLHLKGFGQGIKNRDLGLSPIALGVHSLGAAMAAEESAGKFFANGIQAAGVLSADKLLKPDQRSQLQSQLEKFAGSSRAGKLMVLEAGLKYAQLTINPEDAQLLETRRFSVEEICRWYGVPPIIIGHAAQGQTMWGSGVEQILIAWLTLGIDPICDRIEQRILKQLLRPAGDRQRYAEFNREALLQMDSAAKASFLSSMVQNGIMDRNESRTKLNLPRRDGADALTAQTNLAPLETLGDASDGNQLRSALRNFLRDDESRKEGKE